MQSYAYDFIIGWAVNIKHCRSFPDINRNTAFFPHILSRPIPVPAKDCIIGDVNHRIGMSDTTHTSISLFRISASKATGARTLFLVFDRLHMFTNMQLGTAKSEGLFFLFTGALCNAVRHLLAFSSLTGQDFTGRRDFTTSMAWPSLALSLGFKKASAALFLTLLRPLYLKIPSCFRVFSTGAWGFNANLRRDNKSFRLRNKIVYYYRYCCPYERWLSLLHPQAGSLVVHLGVRD